MADKHGREPHAPTMARPRCACYRTVSQSIAERSPAWSRSGLAYQNE